MCAWCKDAQAHTGSGPGAARLIKHPGSLRHGRSTTQAALSEKPEQVMPQRNPCPGGLDSQSESDRLLQTHQCRTRSLSARSAQPPRARAASPGFSDTRPSRRADTPLSIPRSGSLCGWCAVWLVWRSSGARNAGAAARACPPPPHRRAEVQSVIALSVARTK